MERKRHPWMLGLAIAVSVPVLYLLSFVPIHWAYSRKYLRPGSPTAQVVEAYLAPAQYLYDKGPAWVHDSLVRYENFLAKL